VSLIRVDSLTGSKRQAHECNANKTAISATSFPPLAIVVPARSSLLRLYRRLAIVSRLYYSVCSLQAFFTELFSEIAVVYAELVRQRLLNLG